MHRSALNFRIKALYKCRIYIFYIFYTEPMRVQSKTCNWRHTRENTCRYLLLAEFEVRTVTYSPSFLPIDLWPKRTGHKSKGKNEDPSLTLQTEKTRLVGYLLYLYCAPDGFGKDFYSCGTASNF